MRKRTLAICAVLTVALLGVATTALGSHRKLIVLAGQSNAVGATSDAGLLPTELPKVPFWWDEPGWSNSGMKWVDLTPQPGTFKKGHFGPEFGIAETISSASIFKFAVNATSLADDWRPGSPSGLMQRFLDELDIAINQTDAKPYCFIFVQGESDAQPVMVDAYHDHLVALLGLVRKKLGDAIPIVLSVDELHISVKQFPKIVAVQKEIAASDPKVEFSSFSDLQKYDTTHLVAASTLTQGRRLAEACQSIE